MKWLWLPVSDYACYGSGIALAIDGPQGAERALHDLEDAAAWLQKHAEDVAHAPALVRNAVKDLQVPVLFACASCDLAAVELRVNAESTGMDPACWRHPCLFDEEEAEGLLEIRDEHAEWETPDFKLCSDNLDGSKPSFVLSVRVPALGDAEQCGWNVAEVPVEKLRELLAPVLEQDEAQDAGPGLGR